MVEFFNWLVELFLNTPVQVIVLVLGATGVSVLSQIFKKWFDVENERWMFLIVLGIAFAGSFLDWFLNSSSLPATVIGIQTSVLVGIAQPIYFYAVKPLNLLIAGYRANKKAIHDKLAAVESAPLPTTIETLKDVDTVTSGASLPEAADELIETPRPVATF